MKHKILLLLLLMSSLAWADQDQIVTDVGLGAFSTKGPSLSQVKFAKIGWEEDLWGPFKQKFNTGAWLDSRGPQYSNSAFLGFQLGFEVSNDIFQGSIFTGPNVISNTDASLGGYLEFNESAFFGIVDKDKDAIGIAWNHFSSAGLSSPNLGKDFIGLQIKCPF